MRAILKFFALSNADRILIVRAVSLFIGIWIGLRLFSFGKILAVLNKYSARVSNSGGNSPRNPDKIIWAVSAIGRYLPLRPSCLEQALTARLLLCREGYHSIVRIGIAAGNDRFQAHAWLEHNGKIVVGNKAVEDFHPLPSFDRGHV